MPSPLHINPEARRWRYGGDSEAASTLEQRRQAVLKFHGHLPEYRETPLRSLPSIANELGLGHVLLKDESSRFGLPSFKILGASWAVYCAVRERVDQLEGLAQAITADEDPLLALSVLAGRVERARQKLGDVKLITCTEGNWGRAVARMVGYLKLPAVVYVAAYMNETTRELIRREGALVIPVEGGYDGAAAAAKQAADEDDNSLLVMDIGWEGYEKVPQRVVEGYQTMLDESQKQVEELTGGKQATHAIVPAGCGSVAQAVTQHFKSLASDKHPAARVIVVELDTAACLKLSLERGEMTTVATGDSIMCGMNCGTLSTTAWPVLRAGVDASVVVNDADSHAAVEQLREQGTRAGPCGAASLAALTRACELEMDALGLDGESVVVLFCTEGAREYRVPV
ncbi:tryptophan synthase beta subunit-like PLP-dependent enzyme [Lasiosphaeria miniovina]|uniref:Tryptophan synthase beta subunit-like PLP-dependent enzyme n=1 Tax=Lasiosphaeria miniovina TaxID=1954250 RepID=A0AA40BIF9_9PEZI|nr:tryptophan synthase beta subunit-like PLP-dependent enzyme [Lasiosphaeria miniovina]KAK0734663.1 tryptophan synthase beta subunit-like PLP-dependent enzyme [Lasiosphaeria miniovina]